LIIICLLTFLTSSIGQFFTPAEGATIPMLVGKEDLMLALSHFQVTSLLSTPLGLMLFAPLLIGVLPSFIFMGLLIKPIVSLYFIIALCYLVCALLIAGIPARHFLEPESHAEHSATTGIFTEISSTLQNVWRETKQTWTFVRSRPQLFEAVIQLSFAGVLLLLISQLASPIVTDLLLISPKRNPNAIILIFAPAGIALALSSLFLPGITVRLGKSRTIIIGCLCLALMIILLPFSTTLAHIFEQPGSLHVVVVMIVMFVAGIAINFINTPANTLMQEHTPGWIKGRVLALQLVIYNGSAIPIILLVGGLIRIFSLSTVLYIVAIAVAAFGLWGLYYEHKTKLQRLN
jgi:hypothetical protein